MNSAPPDLADRITERARALGFDHVAFLPTRPIETQDQFHAWMNEGRQADMAWMANHPALRVDPAVLEPGTRTVIALLKNYHHGEDRTPGGLRIARYAHGDDYHDTLRARMKELAAFIHAESGADVSGRPAVDSAPLLERDVARMAGLGWIGKNTMLIRPGLGSFTFLSELLVDIDIAAPTPTRVPNRCGTCSRCIDACPTGAIISPYVLDARRCISYLTIELRGPIPRELRPLIGEHVFGCDICQNVCPWNRKAPTTDDPTLVTRPSYDDLTPEALVALDQAAFSKLFRRSAIKRTKRRGLLRNAAVVLGNREDASLSELLTRRLRTEPEPLVRGHLAWALGRTPGDAAVAGLQEGLEHETDAYVLEELRFALEK